VFGTSVKCSPWLRIGGGRKIWWRGYVAEDPEWKILGVGDHGGSDTNCECLYTSPDNRSTHTRVRVLADQLRKSSLSLSTAPPSLLMFHDSLHLGSPTP
jgi:hypothetical protein